MFLPLLSTVLLMLLAAFFSPHVRAEAWLVIVPVSPRTSGLDNERCYQPRGQARRSRSFRGKRPTRRRLLGRGTRTAAARVALVGGSWIVTRPES